MGTLCLDAFCRAAALAAYMHRESASLGARQASSLPSCASRQLRYAANSAAHAPPPPLALVGSRTFSHASWPRTILPMPECGAREREELYSPWLTATPSRSALVAVELRVAWRTGSHAICLANGCSSSSRRGVPALTLFGATCLWSDVVTFFAVSSHDMCAPPTALALSMRPLTVLVRPLRSTGRRHELGVHGDLM